MGIQRGMLGINIMGTQLKLIFSFLTGKQIFHILPQFSSEISDIQRQNNWSVYIKVLFLSYCPKLNFPPHLSFFV